MKNKNHCDDMEPTVCCTHTSKMTWQCSKIDRQRTRLKQTKKKEKVPTIKVQKIEMHWG